MSKRNPQLLLEDMLLSMEKITSYIGTMDKDSFMRDARTVDAMVRNLEIIGEAASRIPEDFRTIHPQIPYGGLFPSVTPLACNSVWSEANRRRLQLTSYCT